MKVLPNKSLFMTRGDSEALRVSLRNPDKSARPLVPGDKVELTIRRTPEDPNKILHMTVTDFTEGAAVITFTPESTARLMFGTYSYDVQLTLADGTVKTIIKPAPFVIGKEDTYD